MAVNSTPSLSLAIGGHIADKGKQVFDNYILADIINKEEYPIMKKGFIASYEVD